MGALFCCNAFAIEKDTTHLPFRAQASFGYSSIKDLEPDNTGLLRISIAQDLFAFRGSAIGLEIGGQTGYSSKLNLSPEQQLGLGGTALEAEVNPFVDLLATLRKSFNNDDSLTGVFKAGIAYRQVHFDRDTVAGLSKVNAEIQLGLEKMMGEHVGIAAAYQGILSSSPDLTISGPMFEQTGYVNHIPSQHGVVLGFFVRT